MRGIEQRQRLAYRMAGAELFGLHRELHVGCGDRGLDLLGAMPDDDEPGRLQRARGRDDVGEERPAGQRMKHFRQRGTHALAGACRQNHDIHGASLLGDVIGVCTEGFFLENSFASKLLSENR
ncbi:hypothetical protein FEQ05_05059 [Burkholderia pseudomultivorans]|uniref:Uncharacterized protein n=1 Tax=Burkholderia pseudomultivorans TaxID=1207504 RepID=A0ABU2E391_9BURK|nr:hypothetical protein [Burkholderia pseudomultivorans]MDR8754038.1 hypothetical protein [Burkholderia pseudomultivorans]MDR8821325.1 hypothetical protein [Burkholderia pseudomultivorans]MDR8834386.1 hypothetical protein [Burkholderia pseudomultivorans]MDR8871970.1 hypothetical protein [Burkholderia pseudomultivorans]